MKRNQKIIAAICLLLLIPCFVIPVSANSRAQEWFGVDSNGVMVLGENVPIEVTSELLTFDIPTLPYASYRDAETFMAYDSKVTAQYTFHNPTDMTVTATLLFPFGRYPEYARSHGSDSLNSDIYMNKYGVKVNGENVETNIRYTMTKSYNSTYFDTDKEIVKISNDYMSNGDFRFDMPVVKYAYTVYGINDGILDSSDINGIKFSMKYFGDPSGLYFYRNGCRSDFSSYHIELSKAINKNYQTIEFYVLGGDLSRGNVDVGVYTNKYKYTDAVIDVHTTEMTLGDLLLADYDPEKGVSRIDWFNGFVNYIEVTELDYGYKAVDIQRLFTEYYYFVNRWYEYEITLAPGESITNTVTAPLYPEIEAWDKPIEYNYTYYLSPASCWADFGNLEIVINTPYEMTECNVDGFEKTESGYRLVREGLPTNEGKAVDLFFTLENDGNTNLHQPARNFFEGASEFLHEIVVLLFIVGYYLIVALLSIFGINI